MSEIRRRDRRTVVLTWNSTRNRLFCDVPLSVASTACPANSYKASFGFAWTCTPCPKNSGTQGRIGSRSVHECVSASLGSVGPEAVGNVRVEIKGRGEGRERRERKYMALGEVEGAPSYDPPKGA